MARNNRIIHFFSCTVQITKYIYKIRDSIHLTHFNFRDSVYLLKIRTKILDSDYIPCPLDHIQWIELFMKFVMLTQNSRQDYREMRMRVASYHLFWREIIVKQNKSDACAMSYCYVGFYAFYEQHTQWLYPWI